MAGRRLPIRRTLAAAIALSAVAAVPALGQQWVAVPTPGTAQPATGTWQVTPSSGDPTNLWQATPGEGSPTAATTTTTSPTSVDASDILSNFAAVAQANSTAAVPPSPPAAVDVPDSVTVDVQLDPDHPALVALRAAESDLNDVSGALAGVRSKIDQAGPGAAEALQAQAASLEAKQDTLQTKVDGLRAKVDAALAAKRKKAEEDAARAQAAQTLSVGFPTVTGTVPSINPGLASQLDTYLTSKGSPLSGLGNAFVYYGGESGVDPRFLVAISGAETSFGTYGPSQTIHNPFGMGPGIVYPTWQDAIAGAARNLGGRLYKGSSLITISQIQRRWAPEGAGNDPSNLNSNWYRNVSRYYTELGGDANGSVFIGQAAQPTAIPVAPGVAPGIQGTVAAPTAYGMAVAVPGGGRNTGAAALALAQTYLGVPYVWGGTSPKGFDCSGLVQYVYAKQGVTIPRVAADQAKVGTPIAPEQLQPGDAVFFADRSGYIHHEGMYVGGGLFIHAPHTGDVVKISSLYEPYYATQYAGARRY